MSLPVQPVRYHLYGTRCMAKHEQTIKHVITAICSDNDISLDEMHIYIEPGAPFPGTSTPLLVNIYTSKEINTRVRDLIAEELIPYQYVPEDYQIDHIFSPPLPL